jgi:hypothetical protein
MAKNNCSKGFIGGLYKYELSIQGYKQAELVPTGKGVYTIDRSTFVYFKKY